MNKMATKKMTYGGAKTMSKGGKATAKPKMAAGGKVASKKKYAMAGVVSTSNTCKEGDPKCKEGNYNKGRGTGGPKLNIFQRNKQGNFSRKKG
jgi:hypothetical protein